MQCYSIMQLHNNADLQLCNYEIMQIGKYATLQLCNYVIVQAIWPYGNMALWPYLGNMAI